MLNWAGLLLKPICHENKEISIKMQFFSGLFLFMRSTLKEMSFREIEIQNFPFQSSNSIITEVVQLSKHYFVNRELIIVLITV